MIFFYMKNLTIIFFLAFTFIANSTKAAVIDDIKVENNNRVSKETIITYGDIKLGEDYNSDQINVILKNLYKTNFFENIKISIDGKTLIIDVTENKIIQNVIVEGVKSKTMTKQILENIFSKNKTPFLLSKVKLDNKKIKTSLDMMGYYFSTVESQIRENSNDTIDLIFNIKLGNKAKIKKISFIGDKKFKDGKLKALIVSEEYKFWKFISGKKYLNESMIKFDERLLKNFYLNKGYYDVQINSSFAKLLNNDDEFELIFNIDAKNKFFFGDLKIELPTDFETSNYGIIKVFFSDLKDKPYSINKVEKILNKLDLISINEQYQSVKSTVSENIVLNKINLTFKIEETDKFLVERINILGNNITRENVIRNKLLIDEGDLYNEILKNRSLNEIKSLNFFKSVKMDVIDGEDPDSKIININIEEKPTGEISAGAGFGTSGEVIEFSVRENNYLGKGLGLNTSLSLSTTKISGNLNVTNPNYNNSDKSVNFGIQAIENDRISSFGYKSSKYGTSLGTRPAIK